MTGLVVADEFDASCVKGADQLHQRVDIPSDQPFAAFHALDGRHREPRKGRQSALVDAEKRARSPQLRRSNHSGTITYQVPNCYYEFCFLYSPMSTIIIDAYNITLTVAPPVIKQRRDALLGVCRLSGSELPSDRSVRTPGGVGARYPDAAVALDASGGQRVASVFHRPGAIEALRDFMRSRNGRAELNELWRYAEIDRVDSVIRPYIEAMIWRKRQRTLASRCAIG